MKTKVNFAFVIGNTRQTCMFELKRYTLCNLSMQMIWILELFQNWYSIFCFLCVVCWPLSLFLIFFHSRNSRSISGMQWNLFWMAALNKFEYKNSRQQLMTVSRDYKEYNDFWSITSTETYFMEVKLNK